jgi:hypothetical protein
MLRKLVLAGPPLLMLAGLWGWQTRSVAQPPSASETGAAERHAEQHVRYADARLRLAETRLLKAERLNALSPRQVTETDLRRLKSRIDLLRIQVLDTRDQPHGYAVEAQRRAAEAAVGIAEQELASATAVHRLQADAFAQLDVRQAELQLEIARLRAEIWNDPAFRASPTAALQMQIDQLSDQLHDLLHRVDNSPTIDRR